MSRTARIAMAGRVSEAEFQRTVIRHAQLRGWRVAHFRTARSHRGWETPVAADGAGFPDLVLVRGTRVVFAELKSMKGRVSPEQRSWIDALTAVADASNDTVCARVWRPTDWDDIEAVLAAPATTQPAPSTEEHHP